MVLVVGHLNWLSDNSQARDCQLGSSVLSKTRNVAVAAKQVEEWLFAESNKKRIPCEILEQLGEKEGA